MKRKIFTSRYVQVLSLLLVLAIILGVRLFIITVIQNDKWSEASEDISTRSIYTTAPRGEIYDRYGNLLAGNKQSFSVRMSGTGQSNSELNANIVTILGILEGNGDSYSDEFPIKIENGELYYTYETEIASWLEKKGLSTDLTAEEAFDELRNKLGIDPSLDRYAAQLEIQNTYNQYPPISVKQMKYTAEIKKEQFLQTYFGNDKKAAKYDAKEAFAAIREKMEIDKSLSDEEARKIMVIRNDIKSLGYNQYMPAVIAKNVSEDTVMLIEERGESLKGVDVVSETVRYYPNGNFASHILGYMGKITDEEKTELVSKGYENGAVIGKEGIEGKYESVLKGTNGEEKVQVNAKGELQSVISKTDPIKGKDIYLTIDAGLQTAAEDGLEKSLKAMRSGGTVTSEYGHSNIS
ncbi:MAG: penicillin-binding protein, partial [Anaerovoracaceae bacterium]